MGVSDAPRSRDRTRWAVGGDTMQNMEQLNERREFKYLLPASVVPYVRAAARSVCAMDAYAGADGLYTIRSLYFDTDRYALFWANDREAPDRFKVRVRHYPSTGPGGPVFLEVKRRMQDVIHKSRGLLPGIAWAPLLENPGMLQTLELAPKYRPAVERFLTLMHTYQLKPVMMVEYEREAYFSQVDEYARLTFDLHVRCQPVETLSMECDPTRWRYVDHPYRTRTFDPMTLLELKFSGAPPLWMARMVHKLELERHTFSKYGYSVSDQLTLPQPRQSLLAF